MPAHQAMGEFHTRVEDPSSCYSSAGQGGPGWAQVSSDHLQCVSGDMRPGYSGERPLFLFCLYQTWVTPPVRFAGVPDLVRILSAEDVLPPPNG